MVYSPGGWYNSWPTRLISHVSSLFTLTVSTWDYTLEIVLEICISQYTCYCIRLLYCKDASLSTLDYCIGGMHSNLGVLNLESTTASIYISTIQLLFGSCCIICRWKCDSSQGHNRHKTQDTTGVIQVREDIRP